MLSKKLFFPSKVIELSSRIYSATVTFCRLASLALSLYPLIVLSKVWKVRRSKRNSKSVLIFAAFWEGNAGYEYRVARWATILRQRGYLVDVHSCFTENEFTTWVKGNSIWLYVKPAWRRFWRILRSSEYEVVIVRREILVYNDYGNLFMERMLLRIHPHAILDFDDDLAAAKSGLANGSLFGKLLFQTKTKFEVAVNLYRNFLPGSPYLASRFLEPVYKNSSLNEQVSYLVLPTCVDYEDEIPRNYMKDPVGSTVKFGWIGSVGNLYLLDYVLPYLSKLNSVYPIELIVISGINYPSNCVFPVRNISWSMTSQLDSLRQIDIGLMPLLDEVKDVGKCGFKLIQYMGIGIVPVASAIGVNKEIIQHNINGFLVEPDQSWHQVLIKVIEDKENFFAIGASAREAINKRYSFKANEQPFLEFLEAVRIKATQEFN